MKARAPLGKERGEKVSRKKSSLDCFQSQFGWAKRKQSKAEFVYTKRVAVLTLLGKQN